MSSPLFKSFSSDIITGVPAASGQAYSKLYFLDSEVNRPSDSELKILEGREPLLFANDVFAIAKKSLAKRIELATAVDLPFLKAHYSLLSDVDLKVAVLAVIKQGALFFDAVTDEIEKLSKKFLLSKNPLIRERVADLRDISSILLESAYPNCSLTSFVEPSSDYILVAKDFTPSQFMALDKGCCKGIALQNGGLSSHLTILARSYSIPVIINLSSFSFFKGGSDIGMGFIDGDAGFLLINPDKAKINDYFNRIILKEDNLIEDNKLSMAIYANISTSDEAKSALSMGADGVGLFRTEMLYMDREELPQREELVHIFRELRDNMDGQKVIIRLPDIGGDKKSPLFNLLDEDNPFLGVRGVRLYQTIKETVIDMIFAICTLLDESIDLKIPFAPSIMIPMVSNGNQIDFVRDWVESELKERGLSKNLVPVGIMVEIPSAALNASELAKKSDFFSIGTNDLQQYLFAVDRGLATLNELTDNRDPAFISLLIATVDAAKDAGIPCGVCGEAASDFSLLPFFASGGFSSLSLAAPKISHLKKGLSKIEEIAISDIYNQFFEKSKFVSRDSFSSFNLAVNKKLFPLFSLDLIHIDLDYNSREEIIHAMSTLLASKNRSNLATGVEEAIWKREETFSTALGFGFAIPHCKSEYVLSTTAVVFRLRKAISWSLEDPDNKVSNIIMLAVPIADAQNSHMKIFSKLARKIMHEDFRADFGSSATSKTLLEMIESEVAL